MALSSNQVKSAPKTTFKAFLFTLVATFVAMSTIYKSTLLLVVFVKAIFFSLGLHLTFPANIFTGKPLILNSLPVLMFFNEKLLMKVCRLGEKLFGFNLKPAILISG